MRRMKYCSVIRPVNSMTSCRLSLFTLAKLFLLAILLMGSLVHTKKKTTSKLKLKIPKYSKPKLRVNQVDTFDDKIMKEAVCVSRWITNYSKKNLVETKSPLPLTKKELDELIRDTADVLSGKYSNSENFHTEKNYELIKNKLELFGYLSKPTVYGPDHELYKEIWKSFTWRDPVKRVASPQDAKTILDEFEDKLSLLDRREYSTVSEALQDFFQQSLYFDNNNPRMDKFPKSQTTTYNFLTNYKLPESLRELVPRGMSILDVIEDAQNMVSCEPPKWQYLVRHLNIITFNLEKCSSGVTSSIGGASVTVGKSPLKCGEKYEETKIVGGSAAKEKAWPWMALLKIGPKGSDSLGMCGGVLISDRHILTAAHCMIKMPPENVRAYMGEVDSRQLSNSNTVVEGEAERIFMHESYNLEKNEENDIAIIKLKKKTPYTDYIRPICLPPPNIFTYGENAYITGWGHTTEGGKASEDLLEARVSIYSTPECQDAISRHSNKRITEKQLCASRFKGGIDSCQGDSGGPIMFKAKTSSGTDPLWITVGIVSWGVGCGRAEVPGIYTRVSSYLDWINNKLQL